VISRVLCVRVYPHTHTLQATWVYMCHGVSLSQQKEQRENEYEAQEGRDISCPSSVATVISIPEMSSSCTSSGAFSRTSSSWSVENIGLQILEWYSVYLLY
jgi:hypothetical protein